MLQKGIYTIKQITSLTDGIRVHYKKDLLTKNKADKYFSIFEDKLEYLSPEESQITIYGKKFEIPRKQVAYGEEGTYYTFSNTRIHAKSWDTKESNDDNIICTIIKNIKHKVELFTGKKFNFVLINRYNDGDDYINFHADDEKELGDDPTVVGVTLGAEREFKFKPKKDFYPQNMLKYNDNDKDITITLHHGSIIAMYAPTNNNWLHSLPKRANIKKPRISLTFRYLHLD